MFTLYLHQTDRRYTSFSLSWVFIFNHKYLLHTFFFFWCYFFIWSFISTQAFLEFTQFRLKFLQRIICASIYIQAHLWWGKGFGCSQPTNRRMGGKWGNKEAREEVGSHEKHSRTKIRCNLQVGRIIQTFNYSLLWTKKFGIN